VNNAVILGGVVWYSRRGHATE